MKRLLTTSGIFFFIQTVHYVLLAPVSILDVNKVERTVIFWMTLAGLVGLILFWRKREAVRLRQNLTIILWSLQWMWLLGMLWATWQFPWVYVKAPCWLCPSSYVASIHPAIRFSFNFFLLFPCLKFCTQQVVWYKWADRALWHLPLMIYLCYVISLIFEQRPIFMG